MWFRWLRWLGGRETANRANLPVIVYRRQGCHLCEDALSMLRQYERTYRLAICELDIDADPELMAKYGDKVPVVEIAGRVRCWGRINKVLLRRELLAALPKA